MAYTLIPCIIGLSSLNLDQLSFHLESLWSTMLAPASGFSETALALPSAFWASSRILRLVSLSTKPPYLPLSSFKTVLNESEIFPTVSLFFNGSAVLLICSAAFLIFSEASLANSVSEAFLKDSLTVEPTLPAAFVIFSEACLIRSA